MPLSLQRIVLWLCALLPAALPAATILLTGKRHSKKDCQKGNDQFFHGEFNILLKLKKKINSGMDFEACFAE
jgi:hypothetical protein